MMLAFAMLMPLFVGCSTWVEPGYKGLVVTPDGPTGSLLDMGKHTCYGRDRMLLFETKEETYSEHMEIQCADDLNLKVDVNFRISLRDFNFQEAKDLLNKQGSKIKWDGGTGFLSLDTLYDTYVKPVGRPIARTVVSKFQTNTVRENRETATAEIYQKLDKALEGTPVMAIMVSMSNLDLPGVITKAMESRKEREVEIGEERAKQAMKLLKAENRLREAQVLKATRAAEAEAEAVYYKIMSKALGGPTAYLNLRDVEAKLAQVAANEVLYGRVEAGDKVIVQGSIVPLISAK